MKKIFGSLRQKINSLYMKNKKLFVVTISLILIILVCVLFYPKSSTNLEKEQDVNASEQTSQDYASRMESKIKNMLLSLDEVTKASVMIVCDSTEIIEYQTNTNETISDNSTTKNDEVAYEKDGSKNTPIIVTTRSPKIIGVWVIVNSVSASTKLAITNCLQTVLNIDETSINILQER